MIKKIDGIAVVIISLIYAILAFNLEEGLNTSGSLVSSSFPLAIAFMLLVLGLILIVKDGGADHSKIWPKGQLGEEIGKMVWKKIFVFLFILLVYAYVFEFLGFIISTVILSTYISVSLKGKLLKSFLASLCMCVFIYILFVIVLEINLPGGILAGDSY